MARGKRSLGAAPANSAEVPGWRAARSTLKLGP